MSQNISSAFLPTPYIAIGNGRTNVGLLTFKQLDATYAASNANPSEVQTTV